MWLIPFAIAVAIFPVKVATPALFESVMAVVVTACAVLFAALYLKKARTRFVREGIVAGIAWLAISVALDLLMFMEGPMKMSLADYVMDIGLTYLIIPTVTVGLGYAARGR